ncbi:MAG TPA: hypothetical protein VFX50_03905, partial [Gemmatimonadales bacterium]|nr:hypothetical protein [Gemmatimonadales bacterium]
SGADWICLELPPRGDEPEGMQRMECNSGADRVEIFVPHDWSGLSDADFISRIAAAAARH